MTRQLVSPRILARQLIRAAQSTSAHGAECPEAEACSRLDQVRPGLEDWERDEVRREIRSCLAGERF